MERICLKKMLVVIILGVMLFCLITPVTVYAADSLELDLTTGTDDEEDEDEVVEEEEEDEEEEVNNTVNLTINTNNTVTTNNVVEEEEEDTTTDAEVLPDTGLENSTPVIVTILVLSISALYAYKKSNEYKNI